jgi:hypothetical protein
VCLQGDRHAVIFDSKKRNFCFAFAAALGLMLISGLEYRWLALNLARPEKKAVIPKGTLGVVPLEIDGWIGKDLPLDYEAAGMRDADDYLNRSYSCHAGTQRVELFIRCGSRTRDLMPHRPEVCFPGNGWSERSSAIIRLSSGGNRPECKIYQFERQGLEMGSIVVLNYYIIDGQICPDVSSLRAGALRGTRGVSYLAQVQIACFSGIPSDPETAKRR